MSVVNTLSKRPKTIVKKHKLNIIRETLGELLKMMRKKRKEE